jgi:hypothetical protein
VNTFVNFFHELSIFSLIFDATSCISRQKWCHSVPMATTCDLHAIYNLTKLPW